MCRRKEARGCDGRSRRGEDATGEVGRERMCRREEARGCDGGSRRGKNVSEETGGDVTEKVEGRVRWSK